MGIRFQVTLEERQYRHLTALSERQSVPVAELIRRAIDKTYELRSGRRMTGLELSVGVWRPEADAIGRRAGVQIDR
jgi:predicted DNA-binding ribbon-helix-helix protein